MGLIARPSAPITLAKVNRARAAVARAEQFLRTHPGASAAGLVRDLSNTITELENEVMALTMATGD